MKKTLFALMFMAATQFATAQGKTKSTAKTEEPVEAVTDSITDDSGDVAAEAPTNDYNHWSIELGAGGNKPIDPFTPGYSASDETKVINFGNFDHFEGGIRYMLNNKFGLKLDGAYDKIQNYTTNKDNTVIANKDFETIQFRGGLQGVINLGRVLSFEQFTSRIGLLIHMGIQVSTLTPKVGVYKDVTEMNGGFIYGITPQIRISNRFVFHGDVSMMNNIRQHFSWDGQSNASEGETSAIRGSNLTGKMFNASIGLTVYLGSHEKHADWYADAPIVQQAAAAPVEVDLSGITARLDELEKCALDTDKDGVNDCVDQEENSKEGAYVDTKGVTMERPKDGTNGKDGAVIVKETPKVTEIHKGSLLNIFYDVNKDTPNAGSVGDVSLIIGYMIANPDSKIRLIGYADTRGGAATNLALSQRRAKNLTMMVVAKGINQNRIRFDGFGVDKQKSNMSKEEMDYARRTEVIVE